MSDTPPSSPTPSPTPAPAPPQPAPQQIAPAPVPVPTPHPHAKPHAGPIRRFFHYLFMPILWLVRPLVFRVSHEKGNPKVYFTSFSTLIYLWPIMVAGLICVGLDSWHMVGSGILGWAWITVVLLVIICVGADLDRNKAIIIGLLVAVLWLAGALLDAEKQIPILSKIYNFLAAQNVQFEPGTAKVCSIIVFIILLGVVIMAWLDGRYEITTREISHRRVFFSSDSLPRAAKRIKRDWRDITEVIFGIGAGDLIVIDSNRNEVMRIPNIPFLWFFRHDVDHILDVLAITDADEVVADEADDEA